jgi:hypothetical protein
MSMWEDIRNIRFWESTIMIKKHYDGVYRNVAILENIIMEYINVGYA